MNKKKPEKFDPSKVPRGLLFDYFIDWHENMCNGFGHSYKYTKQYPRVSLEERERYFYGKVGPSLESLRKIVESYEDFEDYFNANCEGHVWKKK